MKIKLLKHIEDQANERGISIKDVKETLSNPEQIVPDSGNLKVAQKKYYEDNKEHLIRVIFREEKSLRIGVTVYKTSKINKYWV